MPEFTGNVHSLELTFPFPPPEEGAVGIYVIGKVFGDPAGGSDGLEVWVDDLEETEFDPPDGDKITLRICTLLAVTHGWLRFVPAGETVPGMVDRTGAPITVPDNSLLLQVWPTLRDNLERMAEDGSVLVPQTEAFGKGGRPALDLLLYENVNQLEVQSAIEALILETRPGPPDGPFTDDQRTAMADAFMAGELQILARAGRVIGQAAAGDDGGTIPSGAGVSWRRLTLRAADRFGQLFDPGFFLRRLREAAELTVTLPFISDGKLIPSKESIGNHPLARLTPARRIVDWRDEYGRPVVGANFFLVPEGTDPDSAPAKTTNAWGLWLGETLADGDDPLVVETVIVGATGELERFALGTLPHAPDSDFRLTRDMLADDYLVLSAVDLHDWFPERPAATSPTVEPLRRFTKRNRVTPLVDGRETLLEIYKAIRRTFHDDDFSTYEPGDALPEGPLLSQAARDEHYVYICGWQLSPHLHLPQLPDNYVELQFDPDGTPLTPYDPKGHVMGLLRAAVEAGIDVRALLWRQLQFDPTPLSDNSAAVAQLNEPTTTTPSRRGQAIWDEENRTTGSHHQKMVVIANADGRVAFAGGVDLATGRWDSNEHLPNDPRSQSGLKGTPNEPWTGWHDVHCRVEGPAVDDLEANVRQRWNHNRDAETEGRSLIPSRPDEEPIVPGASHFVQVNRTIPASIARYQFVSQDDGDLSAFQARMNAIRRAREYVYLEEQYLTMVNLADYAALQARPDPLIFTPDDTETIAAALRERIVGPNPVSFVAILIPRTINEEPVVANSVIYELRKRFIDFLTLGLTEEQKRERLLVFHLRNRSGVATYVHAKTMIVDDVWASIGSSNVGYRSMTYDTEINCDVVDGAIRKGKRRYALDLRVRLTSEHLRLQPQARFQVVEPRKGFELLRRAAESDLPRAHHVQPYDPDYIGSDLTAPDPPPVYDPGNSQHEIVREHLVDPDGREPDDPLLDYPAILELIKDLF